MQYGTKKPSGPFRLTLQIAQEPRCPGCTEYLQPCVIEFRDGWAWCQPCIVGELHLEPWIDVVLGSDSMRECSVVVNGLRFYTPDVTCREALTAYDHCQRITDGIPVSVVAEKPDGIYALTPAGESLLEDLSTSGLEQVERDLKKHHCRPQ